MQIDRLHFVLFWPFPRAAHHFMKSCFQWQRQMGPEWSVPCVCICVCGFCNCSFWWLCVSAQAWPSPMHVHVEISWWRYKCISPLYYSQDIILIFKVYECSRFISGWRCSVFVINGDLGLTGGNILFGNDLLPSDTGSREAHLPNLAPSQTQASLFWCISASRH